MKTKRDLGLVFFPAFDWQISPTHPERYERLLYTKDQFEEEGLLDMAGIHSFNPFLASDQDIQRVHACMPSINDRVTDAHRIAAGGAIRAGRVQKKGQVDASFALIRPPGHHAHRLVYGDRGFCVINTEAIMIERLRKDFGPLRVAVVDTDCHHGDGTQDIYYNDPDTLFISIHQDGRTLYPGTGAASDMGGPSAYGMTVNVPLPPQTGEEGFLQVMEELVQPILSDFKPDLLVNSAGQDNHYSDPLTDMRFTAQGYAKLTEALGPDVTVLEGGYSIEGALPYVNVAIGLALAGLDYDQVVEPDYDPEVLAQSKKVSREIEALIERLLWQWQNRKELRRERFGRAADASIVEAERSVFYDTDQILDQQKRRFYLCPDCPGLEQIVSTVAGARLFFIHLPRQACPACQKKAERLYQEAKGYQKVILQDGISDLTQTR